MEMNNNVQKTKDYKIKLKYFFGLLNTELIIKIVLEKSDNYILVKAYHNKESIVKMINLIYEQDNYIYICDIRNYIHPKYVNKGIGTQMMEMLIAFAQENGFRRIEGKLGVIDREAHGDRLEHFYKKQGFNINYYEPKDGFCADIVKIIK